MADLPCHVLAGQHERGAIEFDQFLRHAEYHRGVLGFGDGAAAEAELERLAVAAEWAVAQGLHVAAGHGLDYPNVRPVAALPGVEKAAIWEPEPEVVYAWQR